MTLAVALAGVLSASSRASAQVVPEACLGPFEDGKPKRDSFMINLWLGDSTARAQGKCPIGFRDKAYPISPVTSWRITSTRDDFTDEPRVVLTNYATSPADISLRVRCTGGKLDSYVSTENVVDASEDFAVRFDEKPPSAIQVSNSTDRKGLFVEDVKSFVEAVRDAKRLRVRFTPFVGNPVTATFNLVGFTNHLPALRRAGCSLYERIPIYPPKQH